MNVVLIMIKIIGTSTENTMSPKGPLWLSKDVLSKVIFCFVLTMPQIKPHYSRPYYTDVTLSISHANHLVTFESEIDI